MAVNTGEFVILGDSAYYVYNCIFPTTVSAVSCSLSVSVFIINRNEHILGTAFGVPVRGYDG